MLSCVWPGLSNTPVGPRRLQTHTIARARTHPPTHAQDCIAACEVLDSCCIGQFNPAHTLAKCNLKAAGTLRPKSAKGVTAFTCTGVPCPATPTPEPPGPPQPSPSPPSPPIPPSPSLIRVYPTDRINSIVANAPNRTTFLFTTGVYRGWSIAPRPGDTFIGDSVRDTCVPSLSLFSLSLLSLLLSLCLFCS